MVHGGTAGRTDAKVSGADKDFIHDAAIAGMAEVELGQMAADHATDPEVKKFAHMMVKDHTSAGEKLKTIATENSIEWPTELDGKHRDKAQDLGKKQAAEFDRDYMGFMVDAHNDLIDKLESRIDKQNLSQWKRDIENRPAGKDVR